MNEFDSDIKKIESFVRNVETVEGIELRAMTAGTLAILQLVKNPLIERSGVKDEELFFHLASFLYVHSASLSEVRKSAWDTDIYREKVLEFADGMSIKNLVNAANEIKNIIERATVGLDYQVESDNHPN